MVICEATGCQAEIKCPYGEPGDRLYSREAWRTGIALDGMSPAHIGESGMTEVPIRYECDGALVNWKAYQEDRKGRYRHARFMPRWASRSTVEVVYSGPQLLQEITEEDAKAEGIIEPLPSHGQWCDPHKGREGHWTYRRPYSILWDNLHGDGSWKGNPPVWKVVMKLVREP